MSNMRIILSILLSILLVVSSDRGIEEKVFCNQSLMKAMEYIDDKAPPKFKDAHLKCMESKDKENLNDLDVQCGKRYTVVQVQFVLAVRYPAEFASCVATALKELNKELTKEEKMTIRKLQAEVVKIDKKIREIKGST
ncbi:hypothetical protein TNCT_618341 [Trichonephila clavata]|uniref:Uncharacterized protein n=1 Tax=Trichonephila clavata TaxID=2740835 RepID=A0A8X6KF74_TRICU|nr:hypothetical protein TNCT_618341 [Trichonephila clavata]